MKYFASVILAVLTLGALGQAPADIEHSKSAKKYVNFIDTAEMRRHLYIIASPEMEGRETATPGQRRAAEYIQQHFQSLGLKPGLDTGYQQLFPVYRDSIVKASLVINGNPLKHDSDFVLFTSPGKNTVIDTSEIIFAGYGLSDSTRNDYDGLDARGKIVVVVPGAPLREVKGKQRPGIVPGNYVLQDAAAKNGAAALLIVGERFPRAHQPRIGSMYINREDDSNPATFIISEEIARRILGSGFDSAKISRKTAPVAKTLTVDINLELEKETQQLHSSNVIGMIEGASKKDEAVIITAHYDHIGKRDTVINFGADDDGSGTVTILELAQAFAMASSEGARPERTVIFMTVSGEEKGLWGSEFYAANPVFPMEKTSVNINIDMIGRIESGRKKDSLNYVYVVGDNRLSSDLRPISEAANRKSFNMKLDYKFNAPDDPERIYYRSDHYNFAKNGVPAIFYFNGLHDDYHRPTDTPDKINYPLLAKRAKLIFYTAWEMANREEMLKRDLF